jgi:hypothetical protein
VFAVAGGVLVQGQPAFSSGIGRLTALWHAGIGLMLSCLLYTIR